MILYLDATAFAKLFVLEDESSLVHAQVDAVDVVATSRVSFTELCDALATRRHEGRLTDRELSQIRQHLDDAWPTFALVEVDERAAGTLALSHRLGGFAGLHVAAALELARHADGVPVVFCTFDARQRQAAETEGLLVVPGAS